MTTLLVMIVVVMMLLIPATTYNATQQGGRAFGFVIGAVLTGGCIYVLIAGPRQVRREAAVEIAHRDTLTLSQYDRLSSAPPPCVRSGLSITCSEPIPKQRAVVRVPTPLRSRPLAAAPIQSRLQPGEVIVLARGRPGEKQYFAESNGYFLAFTETDTGWVDGKCCRPGTAEEAVGSLGAGARASLRWVFPERTLLGKLVGLAVALLIGVVLNLLSPAAAIADERRVLLMFSFFLAKAIGIQRGDLLEFWPALLVGGTALYMMSAYTTVLTSMWRRR